MNTYSEYDEFSAMVKKEMDMMQEHVGILTTCLSCRYWAPGEDLIRKVSYGGPANDISLDGGIGQCHRFPPTSPATRSDGAFPSTATRDWCGEWAGRENAGPASGIMRQ